MRLCECKEDGFCLRYQREMTGRFRQICQGVDIDVGTASAFRETWRQEAQLVTPTFSSNGNRTQLLLKNDQAPGDAVAMTAAIYSLHQAHPGKYLTAVHSTWPEVFRYNPDVMENVPGMSPLQMHYPAVHASNDRGIHFMQGWCEHLSAALGVYVPLLTDRPRLYFPDPDPPIENFWVICSGGKSDFTGKLWGHEKYQAVVTQLHGRVRFIQVGAGADNHPRLAGAEDMVGKTTLRELFNMVRRARGVLCGVSLLMHVAAALDRPAIVIAGGREPLAWNAYPKQNYVHTVGALQCTDTQGHVGKACWRSRVLPLGDGSSFDNHTCERPVDGLPLCMRLISPAEVVALVMRYNFM
jgi:ADP-heptose:LPS heptosyltransferase